MAQSNRQGDGGADWHAAEALNFLREANRIQEQNGHSASSGALLYESAKQCINALASHSGVNPGTTGAKLRFLRSVSEWDSAPGDLMRNWQAAARLHIHADRGHLSEREFSDAWLGSQSFINQMMAIYDDGAN